MDNLQQEDINQSNSSSGPGLSPDEEIILISLIDEYSKGKWDYEIDRPAIKKELKILLGKDGWAEGEAPLTIEEEIEFRYLLKNQYSLAYHRSIESDRLYQRFHELEQKKFNLAGSRYLSLAVKLKIVEAQLGCNFDFNSEMMIADYIFRKEQFSGDKFYEGEYAKEELRQYKIKLDKTEPEEFKREQEQSNLNNSSLRRIIRRKKLIKVVEYIENDIAAILGPLIGIPENIKHQEEKPPYKEESTGIDKKPTFNPEAAQTMYVILKDFFSAEHQPLLYEILKTGNSSNGKLTFKDKGNRLTDAFRKLIEHDFITGCTKTVLQEWVIANFNYYSSNEIKNFIKGTVRKTISQNEVICQTPLIEIENRQIRRVNDPRKKKYNKY